MNFNYYIPTRLLFGPGSLNQLHSQELPGQKALIVTTGGTSVKKYGYLDRVIAQLTQAGVDHVLFDKILPNPILDHVMAGAALAKANGVDFVIGLGGGSSIDAAKAIAIMATNPGDYWDYVAGGSGRALPVPNDPLPIIAITTTAGTGTEADPWTVTTKSTTNEKIGFGYDKTFPCLAIIDPELMITVPRNLTAYQGFDALFHSTEGYLNRKAYPISDLYALEAIRLIGKSLPQAVAQGDDLVARTDVALANTLAGMVESTSGCTSEHSLAHAISAHHPKFEHGAALIAISRAYYTYFAQSGQCETRMIAMAKALGKADAACAMDFVTALTDLQESCGVSTLKMSEYGLVYADLQKYIDNAYDTMGGLFQGDPVPLNPPAALIILQNSYR